MLFDQSLLSSGLGQPPGQPLGTGPACGSDSLTHVAHFTHGPQVLHRTLFHKFLVASSHIPPSLSFPLWGKKATISAHGSVPQLLAGPACPQAPRSTACSVPPGFPSCVAVSSLLSMCPRRALFSCSPSSWALQPVPSWPTVSRADSGPFSGTFLYCHLWLEPPCPILISSVPVDLSFSGDTSGTPPSRYSPMLPSVPAAELGHVTKVSQWV